MRFFAALVLGFILFAAAPAPPAAAQSAGVLSAQDAPNMAGSRWEGLASWYNGETRIWTLHFRADGVLEYGYDGQNYDNGRWVQNDQLVTFHTNNYFAVYSGTVHQNSVNGTMHNRRGANGVFSFVRP